MLKFFRTLRKRLLEQGKTTTYIKYAVGEIFLVVIGILIALQLNTWNENRKLNQQEKLYIKRLLQDNRKNLITFAAEIARLEENNHKTEAFCNAFKDKGCSDSLLVLTASDFIIYGTLYPVFNPSISTFEDLSSTGNLSIIKDIGLRDRIVAHYLNYQAAEWEFKVNLDWAIPVDVPLFTDTDPLRFETSTTSFLYPDASLESRANELREFQAAYTRNATIHYWINDDCIGMLNAMSDKTSDLVVLLEGIIQADENGEE